MGAVLAPFVRTMSLELGSLVDNKYLIVRLIGEGGMGAVFEGQNVLIQRRVAIKVLHRATAANQATVTRFEREAQAAGRIGSDHILEVIDLGTLPDGDRYIVMEYLDGEPLSARIKRRGRLTPTELRPLLRQTLVGLSAAHQAGIIHRDLKPDNLFVLTKKAGHTDFVKIIDFGISKFSAVGSNMAMTTAGALMGTPFYMSPEQAKGSPIDGRSDLYAMGVIAYEALAGHVPFSGETFNELMFKIALSTPPPLVEENSEIDPGFAAIVDKMMARNAEDRYSSAEEVIQALDAWTVSTPGPEVVGATATSTLHGPREAHVTSVLKEASGAPRTGASWSTSQADAIPKKSARPLIAIGVAGVVLLAGAAFAVVKLTGGAESEPSPASPDQAPENSAKAAHEPVPVVAPETSAGKSLDAAPSGGSSEKPSGAPEVAPLSAPSASAKAPIKPQVKKQGTRKEKLGSHEFGY